MDASEQRRYRRLLELSPVEFVMGDVGLASYSKVVMLLHSMNISGGGVMVISNVALKDSYVLDMTLNLRGEYIKAKAKVIRCKDAMIPGLFEIALEFVSISQENRCKVLDFIRRRADKEA